MRRHVMGPAETLAHTGYSEGLAATPAPGIHMLRKIACQPKGIVGIFV